MEKILIKNGTIVTLDKANRIIKGSLLVEGDRISRIGNVKDQADIVIDANGKLIIPSLICAHSHMYGAFARGMPLKDHPKNFLEILQKLWWRLDKELTLKDVRLSTEACLVEGIKTGITSFAEHHSSPHAIKNSLDEIANAMKRAGVRGVVCYEVSDRDGPKIAEGGIKENARFIKSSTGNIKGNFGLHASMTLSDETLAKCMEAASGMGFHIHVAESTFDLRDSVEKYGKRTVERLKDRGILGPKTIAAHCVHVDDREIALLKSTGTNVVHNPQSNMNNAVGIAPVPEMMRAGINVGLGTDGFCFDMFREAKVMYTIHKLEKRDPRVMPADMVVKVLFGNSARIVGFDVGSIQPGKLADVVILDYRPPTPLTPENFPWHFIFGMSGQNVETVIADGKVIMEKKNIKVLDEQKVMEQSRRAANNLWDRL